MKILQIKLSEYNIRKKPDYIKLGKKVDKVLEKNFPNGRYLLRVIGSGEHKGLSLNELEKIILKKGTDKYDPKRKAVCHDEFLGYDYDIQASVFEIKKSKLIVEGNKYPTIFGETVYLFYEHTPLDRGYPVRIDLLLIYDPKKLVRSKKINPKFKDVRRGLSKYLYKFKNPRNKKDALLGIIKILK